jgi:hypothetical protein
MMFSNITSLIESFMPPPYITCLAITVNCSKTAFIFYQKKKKFYNNFLIETSLHTFPVLNKHAQNLRFLRTRNRDDKSLPKLVTFMEILVINIYFFFW